eukprot:TRINITY_DN19847_c0_g1_i1.p1 TRINITY_DN19847_c0_g1~~TRINITY_DN19847_c0_g1_i1.p1  ORF type:complete len:160 (+),score=39.36 TRINITY_DN19847_c0_g1_i1:18-497(+)
MGDVARMVGDIGMIHSALFKHKYVESEINYFIREFEKKREGTNEESTMKEALNLLKATDVELVEVEILISGLANQTKDSTTSLIKDIQEKILSQEKKHEEMRGLNVENKRIEEEKEKAVFLESISAQKKQIDKNTNKKVIELESKYKVMATTINPTILS